MEVCSETSDMRCLTVKTDWCMSLEIVNRALDFEKSSALFTISSDMHQSVFTVLKCVYNAAYVNLVMYWFI